MPISYLNSSNPPAMKVTTWLSWMDQDYKKIKDGDTFIAALMGMM